MTRKKVLVTGGAGFIGGNFVQYMVRKYPQYDIYNVDALTYAGDLTKHGSIEVYGELDFDPTTYFTEETPLQPNSPYSASKASSDLLVRAYHKTYGLPMNITR